MKKQFYSELLKHPLWQRKRLEIMKRDRFKCRLCKDTETTLNVHHLLYKDGAKPWEYENKELVTLCECCHAICEELKNDCEFTDIKVFKSTGWTDGSYIIFYSFPGYASIKIFDQDDKFDTGFDFSCQFSDILKIFKHAQNGI